MKKSLNVLFGLLVILALVLSACAPAAATTQAPAPTEAEAEPTEAEAAPTEAEAEPTEAEPTEAEATEEPAADATATSGRGPLASCSHISHGRVRAEWLGRSRRSGAGTRRGREGLAWPRLGEARRTPA